MSSIRFFLLLTFLVLPVICHRKGWSSSSSSSSEEHRRKGDIHIHHHHYGNKKGGFFLTRKPQNDAPPKSTIHTTLPPPTEKCDKGWMSLQRDRFLWCVKVKMINGTQQEGEKHCKKMEATLTGIQNNNERNAIADEGLRVLQKSGSKWPIGAIWLGAKSVKGCHEKSCGPLKTFEWTDGATTGTDGFKWGSGEPDNKKWSTPACIQQFVMTAEYADKAGWNEFHHGDLDKFDCNDAGWPQAKLYACGKKATYS